MLEHEWKIREGPGGREVKCKVCFYIKLFVEGLWCCKKCQGRVHYCNFINKFCLISWGIFYPLPSLVAFMVSTVKDQKQPNNLAEGRMTKKKNFHDKSQSQIARAFQWLCQMWLESQLSISLSLSLSLCLSVCLFFL